MGNPPNIRRIDTSREDAYAFEVTGHISVSDVENIYGLLEGAYELHDKIDLLVLVHHYEGFDWSAALRESTLIGKTHALKHVRRYAVVGGPEWMAAIVRLLNPFFSVQMRHFDMEDKEAAWSWIEASPG